MSNVTVYIVVEGQTEQTFVREVLAPWIGIKEIFLIPALIGKPGQKGGDIRFDRAKEDIGRLLRQRRNTYVSTMFDYFRIEPNWPGKEEVKKHFSNGTILTTEQKAAILENASRDEIEKLFPDCNSKHRFIPYIEMHEFEALLFSDPKSISEKTGISLEDISEILNEYSSPEDINDDPIKAPSKQLLKLKSDYRKVAMGKTISESIGVQKIRKQCPHFNKWLCKIEQIVVY